MNLQKLIFKERLVLNINKLKRTFLTLQMICILGTNTGRRKILTCNQAFSFFCSRRKEKKECLIHNTQYLTKKYRIWTFSDWSRFKKTIILNCVLIGYLSEWKCGFIN